MQKTFIKLKSQWNAGAETSKEAEEMSSTMKKRITSLMKEATTESAESHLPKVPKVFQNPKLVNVTLGKRTFVASNDSHAKNSNNGYSRGTGGAFYCH